MKSTRQFWSGVLVGLSAGSLIRHVSAGGLRQSAIRRIYDVWAPAYSLANVYLLGQLPRLRRTAVARLVLQPGDSVLELACGTGENFPYVEAQVGPDGRLVGLDYTPSMLAQARNLIQKQRWENVELVHADAATFEMDEQFDAVLWMLAASVVPDWQGALARAVDHLKPGGRLVIADARLTNAGMCDPSTGSPI